MVRIGFQGTGFGFKISRAQEFWVWGVKLALTRNPLKLLFEHRRRFGV